jgi:hypothetical protein
MAQPSGKAPHKQYFHKVSPIPRFPQKSLHGQYVCISPSANHLKLPVVTETIVIVLKFEHRERAEILVQTAFF